MYLLNVKLANLSGMPPLPPVSQACKVRLVGTYFFRPWNNILYINYSATAPSAANLNTYAAAVANAWQVNVAPLCNTAVSLTAVDVVDIASNTGASGTASVAIPGTLTGQALPIQAAMVASWHINFRYRGGHPRSYVPAGVPASTVNGNTWTSAFLTSAVAGMSGFLTQMNGISLAAGSTFMISVSFRTLNAPRPTPIKNTITAVSVHPRLDTQRRRLGKEVLT